MKKYILTILFLFLSCIILYAQPCGYPGITISSQADIDNLPANYPGCTELDGLIIFNTNVTNFNALSNITYIGRLMTINNPLLQDFTGLSSLRKVESLMVTDGGAKSLLGLTSLDTIGHTLYIRTPLANFKGLDSVKSIYKIFVQGSYVSPYAINTSFEGLEGVEEIGTIELNTPSVKSFNGLENLKRLGSLSLLNMSILESLDGLANATISGDISIVNAGALNTCSVESICRRMTENGFVKLEGNPAGCNSRAEVITSLGCLTVFPVELISFNGTGSPEGNKLTWETSWETGNKGFSVERSANAFAFKEIGFVPGASDSRMKKQYTFIDIQTNGPAYYRLKQLDWDGTSFYSKIIAVKPAGGITKVYPNPAKGHIYIEQKNSGRGYSLINRQGFTVMESNIFSNPKLDVSALPNDLYMLRVGNETFKILVNNN